MSHRFRAGVAAAAVALGAIGVVGCSNDAPGDVSASASKLLYDQVQRIRSAAKFGTWPQLRSEVRQLKDLVRQQERAGTVSSSRAAAILDAADVLLADARPEPTPTRTSESPTPTPTSESPTPTPTPTTTSPTPTPTPTVTVTTTTGTTTGTTARTPARTTARTTGAASPG